MIADAIAYLVGVLMLTGAIFSLLACVGLLRLPDLYTRIHAASKAGVVGAGLILLAVAVGSGDWTVGLRAIMGILFLLLTTPVSAHLLARAAYSSGLRPADITQINEMQT